MFESVLPFFRRKRHQQTGHQKPRFVDRLANKDILEVGDILQLQAEERFLPPRDVESKAADLAARVERAPQFCRFMKFDELNIRNLYILQHKIISFGTSIPVAETSGALQRPSESATASQSPSTYLETSGALQRPSEIAPASQAPPTYLDTPGDIGQVGFRGLLYPDYPSEPRRRSVSNEHISTPPSEVPQNQPAPPFHSISAPMSPVSAPRTDALNEVMELLKQYSKCFFCLHQLTTLSFLWSLLVR
jgi:hypothetical protein